MTTNAPLTAQAIHTASGRNRIINGSCAVQQYGSISVGATGGIYGGVDRYAAVNSGSTGGTFTQSASTLTFNSVTKPCILQTVTAPGTFTSTNFYAGILQRIEGYNVFDLIGQPMTLSFIFSASQAGTYAVAVRDGTTSNSYVTTITAASNTPTKYIINIPANSSLSIPTSTSIGMYVNIGALNSGTFQTSTLNAWQAGNFYSASGTVSWGATNGATIALTELQLEAGTVATNFERESYQVTLAKCQRYFYSTTVSQFQGNFPASFFNSTNGYFIVPTPVPFRSNISFAVTGAGTWYNIVTVGGTITSVTLPYNQATTGIILEANGTGFTPGATMVSNSSSNAFTLAFNAEL